MLFPHVADAQAAPWAPPECPAGREGGASTVHLVLPILQPLGCSVERAHFILLTANAQAGTVSTPLCRSGDEAQKEEVDLSSHRPRDMLDWLPLAQEGECVVKIS